LTARKISGRFFIFKEPAAVGEKTKSRFLAGPSARLGMTKFEMVVE
jgi:hypothetical protein